MSDPSGPSIPKAIGSLAKKQSDVTRQGTQKLKFVPTLPQRRKKEDVKQELAANPAPPPSQTEQRTSTSRGRGRGDARGRGRGRGAPPVVELTASGPFAMGPSQPGSSGRRSVSQSTTIDVAGATSSVGSNLSQIVPPPLRKEASGKAGKIKIEDEEVYSDPDEGVEIVDMDLVRQMDWMAPEVLQKERQNIQKKFKKQENANDSGGALDTNASHASALQDSEEEDELEDIIENFAAQAKTDDPSLQERLYFFQFPSPFPAFSSSKKINVDQRPNTVEKKVTFAPDVKSEAPTALKSSSVIAEPKPKPTEPVDGLIGQLEVYRSGAVKMRLANNILLDVSGGMQPSFLQQAVYLDKMEKQMVILGEVNKQFVVSPNVDALLSALEKEEFTQSAFEGVENLMKLD